MGYMASGKTTIGDKLSKKLDIPFIDLDQYISEKENLSITEIFNQKGESDFRKSELKYLHELLKSDCSFVLSLGGGTPAVRNAIDIITKYSHSIYLKATVKTLAKRLLPDTIERPMLSSINEDLLVGYIQEQLAERTKYYEKAGLKINVDHLTISETIAAILKEINTY